MCIKVGNENMITILVYVDDIIFGSDIDNLSKRFSKEMQKEFEMSMLGEFPFILGMGISQSNEGILSQTEYIKEMLKKLKMEDFKPVNTPLMRGCKLRKMMIPQKQIKPYICQ